MLLYIIRWKQENALLLPYPTLILFQDYSIERIIDSMKAISSDESLYLR